MENESSKSTQGTIEQASSKKDEMENKRSRVRIYVTYAATYFLFLGGATMIIALLIMGKPDEATNLFMSILPVASGIVAYWFAARPATKQNQKS